MISQAAGGRQSGPREQFALWALLLLIWAYVIIRAIKVPFVQDEGNSFWMYAYSGRFLPFHSHADAGNHFLSSLFGAIGYRLFGYEALGIRWGSVLSYPVYALGCWALVKRFGAPLRWCAFLALAMCPFLLDFFAMFRGYGPAMAGWVWMLHLLIGHINKRKTTDLMLFVVASSLTLFADLSLLPACIISLGLAVLFITDRRPASRPRKVLVEAAILVLLAAVLTYAALIALDFRSKGLLYLGSTQGFMAVTVSSLADAVFSSHGDRALNWMFALPALIALAVALWRGRRLRERREPLIILAAILFLEVLARMIMCGLLGTNYPLDRASVHLLPLYILVVAHLINVAGNAFQPCRWAALILLIFPLRTLQTRNTEKLVDSYEKTMPVRFIKEVNQLEHGLGRPIMLAGLGHFAPAWAFHQVVEGFDPIEMRMDMDPADPDDARIVDRKYLEEYRKGYHVADSSNTGVFLLVRDTPVELELVSDTALSPFESRVEWVHLPLRCPDTDPGAFVLFNATMSTSDSTSNILLVTEITDSTGKYLRYDVVEFRHWPDLTTGTTITVLRYVPRPPEGGTCRFYLWNQRHSRLHVSKLRIQTLEEYKSPVKGRIL